MRYTAHIRFLHGNGNTVSCAEGNTLPQLAKSIAHQRDQDDPGQPFEIVQFRDGRKPILFEQSDRERLFGVAIVMTGLVEEAEKRISK